MSSIEHDSIPVTAAPGVTKEVEAELPPSVRDAVVYLAAASYDAGKHGATDSSSVRDASNELGFAIASALIMNSECWKQMVTNTRAVTEVLQIDLATCRAENAALAKLVDKMIAWNGSNNRSSIDALVARDAIIGEMLALRAGQQKGER